MRNYSEEIKKFYEYVWSFYNLKTGIYPIATDEKIQESVNIFLESKFLQDIEFDSIDRECVRMIMDPEYSIFIP